MMQRFRKIVERMNKNYMSEKILKLSNERREIINILPDDHYKLLNHILDSNKKLEKYAEEYNKILDQLETLLDAKEYVVINNKKNKHISFIVENNANDKRFDYLITNKVVCGRADFCDIVFNDSKMSRYHFCIQKQKKKYIITDMNSTNGTYLNGIKLIESKELKNRDRIFAGNTTITVIFQE